MKGPFPQPCSCRSGSTLSGTGLRNLPSSKDFPSTVPLLIALATAPCAGRLAHSSKADSLPLSRTNCPRPSIIMPPCQVKKNLSPPAQYFTPPSCPIFASSLASLASLSALRFPATTNPHGCIAGSWAANSSSASSSAWCALALSSLLLPIIGDACNASCSLLSSGLAGVGLVLWGSSAIALIRRLIRFSIGLLGPRSLSRNPSRPHRATKSTTFWLSDTAGVVAVVGWAHIICSSAVASASYMVVLLLPNLDAIGIRSDFVSACGRCHSGSPPCPLRGCAYTTAAPTWPSFGFLDPSANPYSSSLPSQLDSRQSSRSGTQGSWPSDHSSAGAGPPTSRPAIR